MALSSDIDIEALALAMIACTLPKAEWTHEGHFAAALWLLRQRAHLATPDAMRGLIMRYNDATTTPNTDTSGYHHSITIASLRAAAHHLAEQAADVPLHVVLAALMAAPQGRSDWLLAHWTRDTLFSAVARRDWVPPDRAPLQF
ncbi:hypothetical protein [Sandarakinorhabdus limnophila]|uniref:hypothetical protein n=1 Tax=Sandarakinorhabdus limnophila TaxID=210512 RepID=UPI0026ECD850|nr:hypothetical protein [Sandarakinorhabdus limnophila]